MVEQNNVNKKIRGDVLPGRDVHVAENLVSSMELSPPVVRALAHDGPDLRRCAAEDGSRVEISDEALCQRVAERDEGAFDQLVERYQGRAYRLAWSILRDAEEARDVSQEAFIRLFQSAGSFGGRSRFSTWFYRLLVNLCLDQRRKTRWWRQIFAGSDGAARLDEESGTTTLERQPAPSIDPLDGLAKEREAERLWTAVGTLSPQQRAVVTLQAQEELSTKEIATILKCSEATVRVHLHRALMTLRRNMGNG
jgi:RNA polymerase sigma-70 factor (ECF subfamily)